MKTLTPATESLDSLRELDLAALELDEEDPEADLAELMRAMGGDWAEEIDAAYFEDEFVREDEFTCHKCNMVLHRSLLSGRRRSICATCAGEVRRAA